MRIGGGMIRSITDADCGPQRPDCGLQRPEGPATTKGTGLGCGLLGRTNTADTAGQCPLPKVPVTSRATQKATGSCDAAVRDLPTRVGRVPRAEVGTGPPPPGRGSGGPAVRGPEPTPSGLSITRRAESRPRSPRRVTAANPDFKSGHKAKPPNMLSAFFATLATHLILTLRFQFPESR